MGCFGGLAPCSGPEGEKNRVILEGTCLDVPHGGAHVPHVTKRGQEPGLTCKIVVDMTSCVRVGAWCGPPSCEILGGGIALSLLRAGGRVAGAIGMGPGPPTRPPSRSGTLAGSAAPRTSTPGSPHPRRVARLADRLVPRGVGRHPRDSASLPGSSSAAPGTTPASTSPRAGRLSDRPPASAVTVSPPVMRMLPPSCATRVDRLRSRVKRQWMSLADVAGAHQGADVRVIGEPEVALHRRRQAMTVGIVQLTSNGSGASARPGRCARRHRAHGHAFQVIRAGGAVGDVPALLDHPLISTEVVADQRQDQHDGMLGHADAVAIGDFGHGQPPVDGRLQGRRGPEPMPAVIASCSLGALASRSAVR